MESLKSTKSKITRGSFLYLLDAPEYQHDKPYYYTGPLPEGQEHLRTNLQYEKHENIEFHDMRGNEAFFTLDRHGFEMTKFPPLSRGSDNALPLNDYMEFVAGYMKEHMKAEFAVSYNYKVRRAEDVAPDGSVLEDKHGAANTPHIDQTVDGGLRRIRRHLSDAEAELYLDNTWRVRIIKLGNPHCLCHVAKSFSVWRPLYRVVETAPLAFCDKRSVDYEDLVAADRVIPEYAGEIYYLKYNPDHRWYWLSKQTPDEVFMFTSYDSYAIRDGGEIPGGGFPHAAFASPDGGPGVKPRESIEIRTIVITK